MTKEVVCYEETRIAPHERQIFALRHVIFPHVEPAADRHLSLRAFDARMSWFTVRAAHRERSCRNPHHPCRGRWPIRVQHAVEPAWCRWRAQVQKCVGTLRHDQRGQHRPIRGAKVVRVLNLVGDTEFALDRQPGHKIQPRDLLCQRICRQPSRYRPDPRARPIRCSLLFIRLPLVMVGSARSPTSTSLSRFESSVSQP